MLKLISRIQEIPDLITLSTGQQITFKTEIILKIQI